MSSNIATIVDYTAQVAAGIPGITAVFGCGQGNIGDPLNPGQTIQPAPDAPTGVYTHWSDLPDATGIEFISQDGTAQYTWQIPMVLWLPRVDLANMRRLALPFYQAYASAFTSNPTLGGLCLVSPRLQFRLDSDTKWAWLDITLEVIEEVGF
jgi:hypothetical protein